MWHFFKQFAIFHIYIFNNSITFDPQLSVRSVLIKNTIYILKAELFTSREHAENYGLGGNCILLRLEGTRVKMENFNRCYQAASFGNPFVIDMSYFDKMNQHATRSASREIQICVQ